ncbi:cytochrome c oxidase assembly protein COX18, mitochondrial [Pogonomyrmex barbatus]|uniref:Cytochrome c oxidase assembly protein COX18, mitochondrial n=1 Tax=Pogonomyrmex barbatus TaxID=144034 RepID=A0A6I9VVI3_9HYME|nr:cytochrome c oxidase assembly protein COX18, mitochondrial [Pogonomyrmex barbatus]
MNLTNLDAFLGRFKRVSKVTINYATCFNVSPNVLPCTSSTFICNGYNTTCLNVQDLTVNKQQFVLNNIIKYDNSKIQNNFPYISHPRHIFYKSLYNEMKYPRHKTCHTGLYYNSIRYLSSTSINFTEGQIPMQFQNNIFKAISESMPVKVTQDSLLWLHDYTGLPWWLIIVLTTVIIRTTVTLPLSLYQLYILAKLENLKHEMDEIVKEMKIEINYGTHKYNWSKEYARRLYNHSMKKQWNKLIVRENCHPAKASLLVLVQVPLWISLSMSIRNLCYMLPKQDIDAYTTYQEFKTGGFLWITDLTIPDFFILPIAMGLFNLTIIEINYMNRVEKLSKWQKYLINFFRIVTIGMIPIAMSVPSCLSLYWTTSSAFGLFQNLILLSPKLHRFTKMPTTISQSHPYLALRDKIAIRCRFKKGVENSPKI